MSVNIQPLSDYVVAEPEEAPTKTASGLYLPEKTAEKPKVAKVLATGKDAKQIKVGDRVLYKDEYGAVNKFKLDNKEVLLIKEENIIATLK